MAHPQFEDHLKTVNNTLIELKADQKPTLLVFNKIDLYEKRNFDELLTQENKVEIVEELKSHLKNTYEHDNIFVSAITKKNVPQLRDKLFEMVTAAYKERYPYKSHFF